MDRRGFLTGAFGAGAVFATSRLPAAETRDDLSLFARRGAWEQLSIAFGAVEIGLEKPFSVLHISDTHLTAAGEEENLKKQTLCCKRTRGFGGRQEEALRDSIAWAKRHCDGLVHTGDLIDWQSEANFALVRKYFGDGLTGCLGNHEFSTDMWLSDPKETPTEAYKENTRGLLAKVYPFDVSLQSTVLNGVNFVTMDDVYGTVTRGQVERFAAEVKKGLPIVLCLHVPLFTDAICRAQAHYWDWRNPKFRRTDIPADEWFLADFRRQREDPVTREFIASLKAQPLLKAILAGHLHFTAEDRFSPTAMQFVVGGNFMFHGREILFS